MPINNNLEERPLLVNLKLGQKPVTEFVHGLDDIKVLAL